MSEVVGAFIRREPVEALAAELITCFLGAWLAFANLALDLGKHILNRVEVWAVRW